MIGGGCRDGVRRKNVRLWSVTVYVYVCMYVCVYVCVRQTDR